MKRIIILCIALLIALSATAGAEEAALSLTFREASGALTEMAEAVSAAAGLEPDEDALEILQFCQYQLLLAESGLIMTAPEEALHEDHDLFAEDAPEAMEEDILPACYSSAPVFIEELGCGRSYEILREGSYIRMETVLYGEDLTAPIEYIRIETAQRPDTAETMILLTQIRYQDLLTSSNRYLVHSDSQSVRSMFRRTFGEDMEFRFDPAAWSNGAEYEWNEQLLYPRVSE